MLTASLVAAYVAAVYCVVVLGVGALTGVQPPTTPLAVTATALVAVTLEPVRGWIRARLLPAPYEELADFSQRMALSGGAGDVAAQMAALLSRATGARRVEVWLAGADGSRDQGCRLAARWPPWSEPVDPRATGVDVHDVLHSGRLVGWLVRDGSGAPLTPVERRLIHSLTDAAGLTLSTLALTTALHEQIAVSAARAEQLRASGQQIVAASDAARRRLEQDIHDGAQQHLVSLAVHLSLAARVTTTDPERAALLLRQSEAAAGAALDTLTDLSHGVYPRLLAEAGLAAALQAAVASSPVPVNVRDDASGRFPTEVEAAGYFSCLEAIQNALKHAGAQAINVTVSNVAGTLCFSVVDDGSGFEQSTTVGRRSGLANMRERVELLGGELLLASSPGVGTVVTGRIPGPARTGSG